MQNHIIGVFDVESKRENAFDDKDERLLNTIAAGLGTAIEKLRLYKAEQAQSQREAAILDLLRTAASSLDLDQVLHSILGQILKVIPSDQARSNFWIGNNLNILAATGREATVFAQRGSIQLVNSL